MLLATDPAKPAVLKECRGIKWFTSSETTDTYEYAIPALDIGCLSMLELRLQGLFKYSDSTLMSPSF